jgi:hypothetical protein
MSDHHPNERHPRYRSSLRVGSARPLPRKSPIGQVAAPSVCGSTSVTEARVFTETRDPQPMGAFA